MPPRDRGRFDAFEPQALNGRWSLTPAHDVVFTARASRHPGRVSSHPQRVYLKGELLKAKADALVVAMEHVEREEGTARHRAALSGRWSADAKNRLVFSVEKADGSQDRLTFQGGWEVGAHHELLYRYRRRLGTRRREAHALIFDGAWEITGTDRLAYRLSGSSDAVFEFTASLQSPSLQARDGRIVYQVGIGLANGRTRTQRVVLFGTWKLHRDLSVSFEMPYADGRRQALTFATSSAFGKDNELTCELRDRRGQPLGVTVTFSRRWLKDARWFLRVRKEGRDAEALAGVQVRF